MGRAVRTKYITGTLYRRPIEWSIVLPESILEAHKTDVRAANTLPYPHEFGFLSDKQATSYDKSSRLHAVASRVSRPSKEKLSFSIESINRPTTSGRERKQ